MLGLRIYLSEYTGKANLKSIFNLKVAATLMSGSSHGVPSYMLELQALTYIEGNDRTGRSIWIYATGTLTS